MVEASDSEEAMDDSKSYVSFGTESIASEYPIESDKYDKNIDKEEENKMLQKITGTIIKLKM